MNIESVLISELRHISNIKNERPGATEVLHFIIRLMRALENDKTPFSEELKIVCAQAQEHTFGYVATTFE